jgi:hypothetical protein
LAENKDDTQLEHEDFKRRARFCVEYAATLSDPSVKATLLDMAEMWRKLAERAKTRERS